MLSFSSLFKKVNTLIIASILLSAGGFASYASASEIVAAPLNPHFVEWQKKIDEAKTSSPAKGSTGDQAAEAFHGYVPSPVNWSHLENEVYSVIKTTNRLGTNPASYDLRPEMPAVRNQGGYGTCWTFSAMAAAESNLIHEKTILTKDNADLSEWYLAYYGFNDESEGLPSFTFDSAKKYYDVGGNDWMSAAILARGTGFLDESSAAYPDPQTEANAYKPDVQARKYKLKNALYLGNLGVKEVRLKDSRINTIKEAIRTYGAVSIGITQGDSDLYLNPTTAAYFIKSEDSGTNHAVTIVGWDDDYATSNFNASPRPTNKGAWIVRNSWGSSFGDSGYYYVSYEEGSLNDGVAYDTVAAPDKEKVYQYDPLGLCNFLTFYDSVKPAYFANIFRASRNEKINSVSFYTSRPDSQCTIEIYKDCGNSPKGGTRVAVKSVTITAPGYNTVDLDSVVEISKYVKFSVVVSILQPDTLDYAIPVEYPITGYSEKATASAGQSFISSDGTTWEDLTGISGYEKANVCLKAFGTSDDTGSGSSGCSTGPGMILLFSLAVMPFMFRGKKD
ncbi:MAG: lectin like domain-containing protein [Synergistaceae bacterium]|nr:lectin like domain-containing protein [Synergistaceae bacterium]